MKQAINMVEYETGVLRLQAMQNRGGSKPSAASA